MTIIKQDSIASTEERIAYLKMFNKLKNTSDEESVDMDEDEEVSDTVITLTQERFDELASQEQFILTLTENGYGKRTSSYQYRTTNRGTQGFDSIVVNQRNGGVVASFSVQPHDEIMLVTDGGQLIRCPIKDIRIAGRRTQGVIVFRVDSPEKVVSVSRIPGDADAENASDGAGIEGTMDSSTE